jgi:hypothetical protein
MIVSLLMVAVGTAVCLAPFWFILSRLGYPPYYCFLLLLPFLNIGFLYYVAFTDWPVERYQDTGQTDA